MLVGNPDRLDENEVTAYMLSIDDRTLCGEDEHTITAIGPSFENWNTETDMAYKAMKEKEQNRLIDVMEKRFPGSERHCAMRKSLPLAPSKGIHLKTAAPWQARSRCSASICSAGSTQGRSVDSLYCCGESTVMGTGTPTVTTSGLSAANALLKKLGKEPYVYHKGMKNYVNIADRPYTSGQMYSNCDAKAGEVMREARRCRFCEHPTCSDKSDIRGIMRRTAVGNFAGAKKCLLKSPADSKALQQYEENCICKIETGRAVEISKVYRIYRRYCLK
jgi:prolycopene isomerase